ncbi:MAG TPA: aminotransferase class III-fold pyridoxal phosphate-dependent enzyme, partial [Bacteroidota bacterium]
QLADGITFSLMHPLEVELAELLRELIPCAEMVRYGKNGADVTSAAVRLARAYTGRDRVVCCGYHGWHDWYISVTDRARGIPSAVRELTSTFEYNDLDSLDSVLDDTVACVIMEPVTVVPPQPGFLEGVRELAHRNGALLIFDEIWTGFRFSLHGAQALFQVTPDLATFSKAMSNGMPLSALVGRKEIMQLLDRDVFFFLTFGGEALSLAASVATINVLRETNALQRIWHQGEKLKEGYNRTAVKFGVGNLTKCVGYPCRTMVTFDETTGLSSLEMKSLVQQELIKRGILWSGFHTVSFSHSDEDVECTLQAYGEVLPVLAEAAAAGDIRSRLRGEPVEPIFRKVTNFNTKPNGPKGKKL